MNYEDIIKLLTDITQEECNAEQVNIYKCTILENRVLYMNEHKRFLYKGNIYYQELYQTYYNQLDELPIALFKLYNLLKKDTLL